MNRIAIMAAVILLLIGGSWYLISKRSGVAPTAAPGTAATLSPDAYPLYNAVSWNAPETESFIIGTTTYSGTSVTSVPVTGTMDPGSVFTPFERYYSQKLAALGYSVDNALAAGGHVGGQTAYRKGDSLILTRFHINYHTLPANAPSECPCDVTLSLFSTER
ncbi:MAG TPA: hypothetical protein VF829_00425 [Candidatus Paceibacterota bacterium]